MKTPQFNRNRFFSLVRIASAGTLISAAAAMAFVAANPSSPLLSGKSDSKDAINKLSEDRVELFQNKLARPGPEREGGPTAAAEQAYALRAYPAKNIPFKLTRGAQKAWANKLAAAQKRAAAQGAQTQGAQSLSAQINTLITNPWILQGPSGGSFPAVLTFSSTPYITSGRITALAVDPACVAGNCRMWAAAAGGGVWRTNNAYGNPPSWTFVSGSFATNAIGTLTFDAGTATLYAGTGEPNASGDSEAGFGIYKSTDGGNTWTHLAAATAVGSASVDCDAANGVTAGTFGTRTAPAYAGPAFDGRAISSILVSGTTMFVSSARAVRGVTAVAGGTSVSLAPGLPPYGVWKSTDSGATFTLLNYEAICLNPTLEGNAGIIQSSFGSTRGVHHAELDPGYPGNTTLYAAPFPRNNGVPQNTGGGVYRSADDGASWTQIKTALNRALNTDRASFAVTTSGGNTRMYVGVGNASIAACATCDGGSNQARLYRSDNVTTAVPVFTDLTAVQEASPAHNQTLNYCGDEGAGAQCWYDNVVYSPPGKPDVVYLGGSFNYSRYGHRNNGRAFIRSEDAGVTFYDQTWDSATNPLPPGNCCATGNTTAANGMHPDSHAMVALPSTNAAVFGGDGGLMRSSLGFTDISSQCATRGLGAASLATCKQLLKKVPVTLFSLNQGLSTLQFQSLSIAPDNPSHMQGGTQDNGTFESYTSALTWPQIIYGDGGLSGFSSNPAALGPYGPHDLRVNTFTSAFHDVNFQNGDPTKWVIASGPITASGESALFYNPIIADPNPAAAGTIFAGAVSVWRTQDWAGSQAFLEATCPEFTTSGTNPACGDFVRIGPGVTNLTASGPFPFDYRGSTRAGGNVGALARVATDTGTLWAATTTGRVFVSKNADNADPTLVTYTRIDTLAANSPGRFISGIYVDPTNPNHAWLSYSSYSTLDSTTPGHVFSVTFNPVGPSATWTNLDGAGPTMFPDFPATGIAADTNGDVYASNDWGVLRLPNGSPDWEVAGTALPMVEVTGLNIVPSARVLYASTHGRSAWKLRLP